MSDIEPNELTTPNYEVRESAEKVKKWFGEYKEYLWGIEQELLKNEGREFKSLDEYMHNMYEEYVKRNPPLPKDQKPTFSVRDQDNYEVWSSKFYLALSDYTQKQWQSFFIYNPFLDEPRQRAMQWDKERFDYARQFEPKERNKSLDEYEVDHPYVPVAYALGFLISNEKAFLEWAKANNEDSFSKHVEKYDFSSGFGVSVLDWGGPRKLGTKEGFLVHVTGENNLKAMRQTGYIGTFNEGRSTSFSINRFAFDGDTAVLVPIKVLQESGMPMVEVSEARDAKALREVIALPIPLDLCVVIDTDVVPDKRPTMNTPNSNKGTYYGEEYLRNLAKSLNL